MDCATKEELLRSNTPKVTKLEGKKGGAAPERPLSSSGAGRSKVEQKKLIKKIPKPKQILRHILDIITS